jgi:hypothetical protein
MYRQTARCVIDLAQSRYLFLRQIKPVPLKVLKLRKMIRPQGLADPVVLGKPAPQIHHLAAIRAEGAHRRAEKFGNCAANRARNKIRGGHLKATFSESPNP